MELARSHDKAISRPLRVLVPLIKDDLKQGNEAAKSASMPYFQAAGEKLLEAKGQMPHGEFTGWVKRNFDVSTVTANKYMDLARATSGDQKLRASDFPSLNAFHKATGDSQYMPNKPRPQPWHEPVKEAIGRVNVEALKQDALARQDERALQRKLALNLIDIGYKALATKLHPDKGGSREAMARLNRVRDMLRSAVSS